MGTEMNDIGRMRSIVAAALAGFLGMLLWLPAAQAATRVWDGGGSNNDFTNQFNWSSDLTPGNGDAGYIGGGYTAEANFNFYYHPVAFLVLGHDSGTPGGTTVLNITQPNTDLANQGALEMAKAWGPGTADDLSATLNVLQGTSENKGGIYKHSGTGTATVNVAGGGLLMFNSTIGTPTGGIDTLAFRAGNIGGAAAGYLGNADPGKNSATTEDALILRNTTIGFPLTLQSPTNQALVFEADNNGTGTISAALDLGSGPRTFNIGDGTAGTDMLVSGDISGTAAIIKTGPGTLAFSGANTYSSPMTVNAGVFKVLNTGALATDVTVNAGGTFDLNALNFGTGAVLRSATLAGTGATGQVGALVNTSGAAESAIYNVTLSDDTTIGTTGHKLNLRGTVDGQGHVLTIAGTGETNVRVDNSLTNLGGVTVDSGRLRLESSQNWAGTYTVNSGGILDTWGGRNVQGAVILDGGTLGAEGGGLTQYHGPITVNSNSVVNAAGGRLDFHAAVSGTGTITKTGGNVLDIWAGVNSLGGLVVSAGRVRQENTGFGSWAGPVTVNSGATLSRWGAGSTDVTLTLNGGKIQQENSGTGTYTGSVTVNSDSTFGVDGGNLVFTGAFGGGGGLYVSGIHEANLAGTGGIGGLFYVQGNSTTNVTNQFSAAGKSIVRGGGTLNWSGTGALQTAADNWAGVGDGGNGTLNVTAGSLTFTPAWGLFIGNASTGVVTVSGGTLTVGNDAPVLIGGINTVPNGIGTLTISGTGRMVASGTAVQAIRVGSVPLTSSNGTLNLDGGSLETARSIGKATDATGILNFNGGVLKALGDNGNWVSGLTHAYVRGGGALVDTNGHDATIPQDLEHDPGLGGTADGGLTKSGDGILTLSGGNSYTGPTTVNGGVLKVTNTGALATDVVVNAGGTFDLNALDFGLGGALRSATLAGTGAPGQVGALVNTAPMPPESSIHQVTLAGDATVGTTAGKLNLRGTVDGQGHVLTIAGTGETNVRIDNALTNLGGVTVSSGRFRLESSQNWPGVYTVHGGAILDTWGNRTIGGGVNLNGGTLAAYNGTGTWNGPITVNSHSAIETSGDMVLTGPVSGGGALDKNGGGTLTLAGSGGIGGILYGNNGTINVTGSGFSANQVRVGYAGGNTTLNQTSGTMSTSSDLYVSDGQNSGNPATVGTYNLHGGTVNVGGEHMVVGRGSVGSVVQDGDSEVNARRLFIGEFGNTAGSSYTISDGVLNASQRVEVGRSQAATFTQTGGIVNFLGVEPAPDDFSLLVGRGSNAGVYNLQGGQLNVGVLRKGANGEFNFTGGTLQADSIEFDLVQQGGSLAPGNSPGTTGILGDYDLLAGTLAIEINGYDQGMDPGYDFVGVSGDALLDSRLMVDLLDGWFPAAYSEFDVLSATSITLGSGFYLDQNAIGREIFDAFVVSGEGGDILRLRVAVPEPRSGALLGLGMMAVLALARRRR